MNMCLRCGDRLLFGMSCTCSSPDERETTAGLLDRIAALEAEVRELKAIVPALWKPITNRVEDDDEPLV
jgi:hypothetical protein